MRSIDAGCRVLVWGGRGFIGRHLVSTLLEHGAQVSVLTRTDSASPEPSWADRVEWYEWGSGGNGHDRVDTFRDAVASNELIFNLAGASGAVDSNRRPIENLESNCRFQLEFLQACAAARHSPHVVFASSRLVYAPAGRSPIAEDAPVSPRSMYAAHKLCAEHYHQIFARAGGLTFTVCRISNAFGIDEHVAGKGYGLINTLIQRGLSGLPLILFGDGTQLRDYLYVSDLVSALLLCGARGQARNETFNIACGASLSLYDAAVAIRERTGAPIERRAWPGEYEAVESGDYVADISKANAALGFRPRHRFEDGLDEILKIVESRLNVTANVS